MIMSKDSKGKYERVGKLLGVLADRRMEFSRKCARLMLIYAKEPAPAEDYMDEKQKAYDLIKKQEMKVREWHAIVKPCYRLLSLLCR